MAKLGLCPRCAKHIYSSWSHARNDARALNRKKMNTGRQHVYRCPLGNIHVGKDTSHKRKRAAR